jgi:hypothetical protein
MVFELPRPSIDITDDDFNTIYPQAIRVPSSKHWSPVAVAKAASEFLIDLLNHSTTNDVQENKALV